MEADHSTSATQVISSPAAADLLLNPETQRLIHPFLDRERTAAVAAKELGMSTSALLYRLNQLIDHGILKIVREEARAGRASKIYTAASRSFFVPFRVTNAETLERYLQGVKRHYEQLLTTSIATLMRDMDEEWGMRVYKDEEGRVQTLTAVYPDSVMRLDEVGPAVFDFYYPSLQLDFDKAKALQRELGELLYKYAREKGAQKYLIHIGLVPLRPEEHHVTE